MTDVDWNLELAHVTWGHEDAGESVQEAMAQGRDWIARWRAEDRSYVTCCLVDDKEVAVTDRKAWLHEQAHAFPALFNLLDYICFESDLISLKGEFLGRFKPPQRGKVEREIERYRARHGKVACSHDIAIWHALRLGLLPSGTGLMHKLSDTDQGPYGREILSILEEEDRAPEDRAKEILRHVADGAVKRVHLEFYA